MKKIGVISDIHGNIVALKAVLELLDGEGCEEIIHTGWDSEVHWFSMLMLRFCANVVRNA